MATYGGAQVLANAQAGGSTNQLGNYAYLHLQGVPNTYTVQYAMAMSASTTVITQAMWLSAVDPGCFGNAITVNYIPEQPPLTEEEKARLKKLDEERAQARARAKKLLMMLLSEQQQEQFEKESSFELEVNERLYRIKTGSRVERLNRETKKVESYFCIHPERYLPWEDIAVSQKLLLEANEQEFLRLANETRAA
jgi:hypothetical protein